MPDIVITNNNVLDTSKNSYLSAVIAFICKYPKWNHVLSFLVS